MICVDMFNTKLQSDQQQGTKHESSILQKSLVTTALFPAMQLSFGLGSWSSALLLLVRFNTQDGGSPYHMDCPPMADC